MSKHSGPDFRKTAPPVVPCEACTGTGVTLGVFYELECQRCGAFGYLHAVTGEVLEHADQVQVLREHREYWKRRYELLQQSIKQNSLDSTPQYPDNLRMRD